MTDQTAATEATELDKGRRYLRPVAPLDLPGHPDDVHLSVLQWLPQVDAWATGTALCGFSTRQGALPEGTEATCVDCLERQPDYERYLAPGYRPEGDDPKALRQRAETAEAALDRVQKLHVDDGFGGCGECTDVYHVPWPCRTLRAVNGEAL